MHKITQTSLHNIGNQNQSCEISTPIKEGFSERTAGISYVDDVLFDQHYAETKSRFTKIIHMSPKRYIEVCAEGFSDNRQNFSDSPSSTSYASLYSSRAQDREVIEKLKKVIQTSDIDMGYLEYSFRDGDLYCFSQEGIHRAIAAIELGIDKIPVVIMVSKDYQSDIDNEMLKAKLVEISTKLDNSKSMKEQLETVEETEEWLKTDHNKAQLYTEINAQKQALKNVEEMHKELGEQNKRISYKYIKNDIPTLRHEWSNSDQEVFNKNTEKRAELAKQKLTIKEILRKLNDYTPVEYIQQSLFTNNSGKELTEQIAYHGSYAEFDNFDPLKVKDYRYGWGFYFTRSEHYAQDYGNVKQYEIPDDEYLLDWENSYNYQPEIVQDALYEIWQEIKNKDSENIFEKTLFGDFCNNGYWIYAQLSEVLKLSSEQTSALLYKHGIKGVHSLEGNCIVVFNSKDIKVKNTFAKINEQLADILEDAAMYQSNQPTFKDFYNYVIVKR